MTAVGIRDLKTNLSRYLKRVRAGTPVQVTEHGRPIATIVPITPAADLSWAHQLVAEGSAHWNGAKPGQRGTPVALTRGRTRASDIVLTDRR